MSIDKLHERIYAPYGFLTVLASGTVTNTRAVAPGARRTRSARSGGSRSQGAIFTRPSSVRTTW